MRAGAAAIAGQPTPAGPSAASTPYSKPSAAGSELAGTPVKVNAANPGYCATDLNSRSGFRTAAEGASVSVHLATLPDDGPTGTLWGHLWGGPGPGQYGTLPW
jgi:hypothetical protein